MGVGREKQASPVLSSQAPLLIGGINPLPARHPFSKEGERAQGPRRLREEEPGGDGMRLESHRGLAGGTARVDERGRGRGSKGLKGVCERVCERER